MATANLGQRFVRALLDKETGWKTTHFWGPVANWGISLAAVNDMVTKGPKVLIIIFFIFFGWKRIF